MSKFLAWFNIDNAPAPVRHAIIVFGSTFLGVYASAIIAAQGVTAVMWGDTLTLGLNRAAVATVTGLVVLTVLPVTRQYGVGSQSPGDLPVVDDPTLAPQE